MLFTADFMNFLYGQPRKFLVAGASREWGGGWALSTFQLPRSLFSRVFQSHLGDARGDQDSSFSDTASAVHPAARWTRGFLLQIFSRVK